MQGQGKLDKELAEHLQDTRRGKKKKKMVDGLKDKITNPFVGFVCTWHCLHASNLCQWILTRLHRFASISAQNFNHTLSGF